MYCIGGPLHGQKHCVEGGVNRLDVTVTPLVTREQLDDPTPPHLSRVRPYSYRLFRHGYTACWVPESVQPGKELEFLIEAARHTDAVYGM